jgi:hypothetical protein
MGMYDSINVYMECPYCGDHRLFDAQTKDLTPACYNYHVYRGKKDIIDRTKMPVFESTPNDKSPSVWANQDERSRAMAAVPEAFKELKFVNVIAGCHSPECQFYADREDILRQGSPSGFGRQFKGKISIKDGLLTGNIYDIEKDNLSDKKLDKWKEKYPKEYKMLMKKYKHEPFAVRAWNRELPSFIRMIINPKKKKITSKRIKFTKTTTTGKKR